jgi:hypothetical protein
MVAGMKVTVLHKLFVTIVSSPAEVVKSSVSIFSLMGSTVCTVELALGDFSQLDRLYSQARCPPCHLTIFPMA